MLLICGCPAHHYRRRLLQAVPSNLATLSILSALCRVPGWVCGLSGLCPVSVSLIPSSFCVAKITMASGKRDDASIWASCCLRVIFPAFFSSYLLFSFFLHLFLCLSVCVSDILNISPSMGRCQIFLLLPFSTPFWPATNRFDLHNSAHNSTHSFFLFSLSLLAVVVGCLHIFWQLSGSNKLEFHSPAPSQLLSLTVSATSNKKKERRKFQTKKN